MKKIKKAFMLIVLIFTTINLSAQDLVILKSGEETVIAVKKENRSIFVENEKELQDQVDLTSKWFAGNSGWSFMRSVP